VTRQKPPVTLGETYQDTTTGIVGVATSRHEFLFGCVRVGLEWGKDGEAKSEVIDEQRLVMIDGSKPRATAKTGGNQTVPSARTTGKR
jgi:hypothetical protein